MAKERLPALPFYPRDWLSSETVSRLRRKHPRVYAIYFDLLCRSWLSEPPATLPNDQEELAALAFVSVDEFKAAWPLIEHEFLADEQGRIYNVKLLNNYKRAQGYKKRAKAGGIAKAKRNRHKSNGLAEI